MSWDLVKACTVAIATPEGNIQVHLQGNDVTPRCNLYRQYFRDRLRVSQ